MNSGNSKRIIQTFSYQLDAKPDIIFPLLCPVREYDWIEGWSCQTIYSESGLAENNCIFTTQLPHTGQATWVVSTYDPEQYRIGFVIFNPTTHVEKLDIKICIKPDSSFSIITWKRTYTGLHNEGNRFIERITGVELKERMDRVNEALQYYLKTGKKL